MRATSVLVACLLAGGEALKMNSWQARLDKSLLDVDLGLGSRIRLFAKAVSDPALVQDVRASVDVLSKSGFAKGHPEVIERLFPRGTTARADLEGLTALRKQLPEVLRQQPAMPSAAPTGSRPASNASPPLPDATEAFNSIVKLATDREAQLKLKDEAKDLLRRTPKNLETPAYTVVRTIPGPIVLGSAEEIELRAYEPFTVARTRMEGGVASSAAGAGFNTLASYLFGKNAREMPMAMTMPVLSTMAAEGEDGGSMAFVLPKRYAEAPPEPLAGTDVTIDTVPARLVAVKAFSGIATSEEVERQTAALLGAIAADGSLEVVEGKGVSVLQYNSPLTVPWRRRNEIAIVVNDKTSFFGLGGKGQAEQPEGPQVAERTTAPPTAQDTVTSYADAAAAAEAAGATNDTADDTGGPVDEPAAGDAKDI